MYTLKLLLYKIKIQLSNYMILKLFLTYTYNNSCLKKENVFESSENILKA